MTAPVLSVRTLRAGYPGRTVIPELDVAFEPGKITMIIGANACGKSTLLGTIARLHPPLAGEVLLDGADVHSIPRRDYARVVGLLPQHPSAPDGLTVAELVARGRYPHRGLFRRWNSEDADRVDDAMRRTGVVELADRSVGELSGGQRQRVWIAMVLAQNTQILLLDEPTTFLDLHHQLEVLDLLREVNRTEGTTIVVVLHDLNLAARYADELLVLRAGEVVAHGAPSEVLSAEAVKSAFDVHAMVIPDPLTNTPMIVPIPKGAHSATDRV